MRTLARLGSRPSLASAALWLLVLCALLLAGCGRSTVVRREHPGRSDHPPTRTVHRASTATSTSSVIVRRGDTVYGIAFRAGIDFRDLARWNGIAPPYTIYPGQRLQLRGHVVRKPGTITQAPPRVASAPRPPRPAPRPSPPAPSNAPPPAPRVPAVPAHAPTAWHWPTNGALVARYVVGDSTRQGIDIAGSAGQAVAAAAAGTVVYSGSGLVGYGELVIVKHSDEWLSAYGHNRRRLVAEGERVSAGQTIAEMGRTGASRDMLHFEIRRNGKPVDPLPLLPPR